MLPRARALPPGLVTALKLRLPKDRAILWPFNCRQSKVFSKQLLATFPLGLSPGFFRSYHELDQMLSLQGPPVEGRLGESLMERVLILGTPLRLDSSVCPALVSTPGRTVPGLVPVPIGGCRSEGPGCGEPRQARFSLF